jgi:hypothetical protein
MGYIACFARTPRIRGQRREDQQLKLEIKNGKLNVPNPMRYNEIPRMPTSRLTPNPSAIVGNPGVTIVVPKFATKMATDTVSVTCLKSLVRPEGKRAPFLPFWPIAWVFGITITIPTYFSRCNAFLWSKRLVGRCRCLRFLARL